MCSSPLSSGTVKFGTDSIRVRRDVEADRFGRDEQDVDWLGKARGDLGSGGEVTERGAADRDPPVRNQLGGRLASDHHDVGTTV